MTERSDVLGTILVQVYVEDCGVRMRLLSGPTIRKL
jgi:hypothetical protein